VHRQFDRRLYFCIVGSSDATLTRWSHPSYLSAASLLVQTLNLTVAAGRARLPPSPPSPVIPFARVCPVHLAGPPPSPPVTRVAPPRQSACAEHPPSPPLGFRPRRHFQPSAAAGPRWCAPRDAQGPFRPPAGTSCRPSLLCGEISCIQP
jgi:hypothetical protein